MSTASTAVVGDSPAVRDRADVRRQIRLVVVLAIATLLLLAAGLVVLQRRMALAERLEYQRRSGLMLERRVT